VQSGT